MDWEGWALTYGLLIDSASGFALAGLGLAVLALARRSRAGDILLVRSLVALLIAWGGFVALRNLEPVGTPLWRFLLADALGIVVLPAAVALALRFPRPLRHRAPLVHALAMTVGFVAAHLTWGAPTGLDGNITRSAALLSERLGLTFILALLAMRSLPEPDVRRAALAVTVAIGPFLGLAAGVGALAALSHGNLLPGVPATVSMSPKSYGLRRATSRKRVIASRARGDSDCAFAS